LLVRITVPEVIMATDKRYCIEKTSDTRFAVRAKGYRSLARAAMFMAVACVTLVLSSQAHAQRREAQATRDAEISVFAGYTNAAPDYGRFRDNGATFGADYTRYLHRLVSPSVEVRANFVTGTTVSESNFLAGFRLQADAKRFHPYVDALFGLNHFTINTPVNPNYTHDNAFAKSFGGGINFDIYMSFQAKVDVQYEMLNYGNNVTIPNNADFTLTPTYITGGIVYRLPFRKPNQQTSNP
jgi:hypothetical protein